jgi:hypothetical protein
LAALVIETEKRIAAADQTAELEREKAFDPMLSPDPIKARDAMEEAVICAGRLRTLLPRLRTREREAKAAEYAASWETDYRRIEAKRTSGRICGGLPLLNPPKIGWEIRIGSARSRQSNQPRELTERDYLADVRQCFCHGVVARPNPKWRSRTDKWRRCRPTHLVFGLSIFPISVTAVMECGVITIIMGFPPLSVAWTR